MNPRSLLLAALRNEETPRPAWVPFVGVHGGHLIGVRADEYLQSSDHMMEGLTAAIERYRPDGIPVSFDLQMEAEILGCNLAWAEEVPPSVTSHPLQADSDPASLPEFDPAKGRFPIALDVCRRLREKYGDDLGLYGLICGPFTLASHLRGSEIFLDMMMDPAGVGRLMAFCTEVCRRASSAYLDAGADIIAVVDPMTSQISPEHFEEFVTPSVNAVFDHIREHGGLSSMFVCGDATRNLEVMCKTHCDNVSVDENISLEDLRDIAGRYGKSFGGNLKLTVVLLLGSEADAKLDAIRCIDTSGGKGFVLAPGCDLPYAVPPANLEAVAEMVHDAYQRDVARTSLVATEMEAFDDIQLPDYSAQPEVYLDVVTLDSAACAPCQYMVDVARRAADKAGKPVVVREHKVKVREGVGHMCKLGVGKIPTICIDGEITFESRVPDVDTLARAIEESAMRKKVTT
jgi:uroporphyrinogen decarboxylase